MGSPTKWNGRVLFVHVPYRNYGGEDRVVAAEAELLDADGCDVEVLSLPNPVSARGAIVDLSRVLNNQSAARDVIDRVERFAPDVIHYHNTWFAAGPAALRVSTPLPVRRVVTVHNYRLSCANGDHFRDGHVCTECLGANRWPAIEHACYRESRVLSALSVGVARQTIRALNGPTIDQVVCVSDQVRLIAHRAGVSTDRTVVVPNFAFDPLAGDDPRPAHRRSDVVFAGRLNTTKGCQVLLAAWALAQRRPEFPAGALLHLAGSRDPATTVDPAPNVIEHGFLAQPVLADLIGRCRGLVFPSLSWEGQPLTVIEALACGTPVLGADQPPIREMLTGSSAGRLHPPGDAEALADQLVAQLVTATDELDRQIDAARALYERRFAPAAHLESLKSVYRFGR